MPALRQSLHTPCMRKPQAQDAGSQSDIRCQRSPVLAHCGDKARPDPPTHQPLPPTPAQLSGQKVGWAPGLGQQRREGQVPKQVPWGLQEIHVKGKFQVAAGGQAWGQLEPCTGGETQARPCPEGQWALCVQVRGRVRACPQVG